MTPTDAPTDRDDDLRIAEYVLGVLNARERETVEAQIASSAEFARRHAAWQERLAPLVEEIEPIPVPNDLWSRIEAQLDLATAPARQRPVPAEKPATFWDNLALWRWAGVGGLALSLVLGSVMLWSSLPIGITSQPTLAATLQLDSGQAVFAVTVDPSRERLVIIPTAPVDLVDRAAELWLIAPGQQPVSLGLLASDRALSLAIPPNLQDSAQPKTLFAVSLEPPGGSPTGQPTGPVIAKGEIFSF
ncbi:anti-sigma factor [Pseudomonas sp. TCU-HL1]|uniref:anti-sigma factor n=1 Tax=Pseudomonas sp. TCU-HL1 TaxID=1856685 RepID=UPI00083CC019|nr:anti-sigma factor [Pseudomonas sp. TCU-HL1]AOE85179.1 hypothetical protein THL1_2631 [Pseudomonas sp. TCU-HL1]